VELAHGGLEIADQAMDMLCRASFVREVGIVAGRLLYLVRLGLSLVDCPDGRAPTFSPDEAAPAINMAKLAWEGQTNRGMSDED
jgi:hypothetical protein